LILVAIVEWHWNRDLLILSDRYRLNFPGVILNTWIPVRACTNDHGFTRAGNKVLLPMYLVLCRHG